MSLSSINFLLIAGLPCCYIVYDNSKVTSISHHPHESLTLTTSISYLPLKLITITLQKITSESSSIPSFSPFSAPPMEVHCVNAGSTSLQSPAQQDILHK